MSRLVIIVLATLLVVGNTATGYAAQLQVETQSSLQSVSIMVSEDGRALVNEVHNVLLPSGDSPFSLTWRDAKIDRASVLLLPSGEVQVSGPWYPAGTDKTVKWRLSAPAAGLQELHLLYVIDGLSFVPEYTLTLAPAGGEGELNCSLAVTNNTNRGLENVTLLIGRRKFARQRLDSGETITLQYLRAPKVKVSRVLVADVARFGNVAAVIDSFENTAEGGLGTMPLPGGKIRVFKQQSGAAPVAVGESTIPRVAVGERAEFLIAFDQGITAKRTLTLSRQTNVRKDAGQRVVVFDLEEEVCIDLQNRLAESVDLQVVDHVDGHWDLVSASVPPERVDAATIRFPVTIPAKGTTQVRYRVIRRNLAP